jgi:hypothetical protein
MSDLVSALVLLAVVAFVIISQVKGMTLSGRRMVLLPAVLIGFGAVNLAGLHGVGGLDIACIAVSAAIAAAIGLGQGSAMHLESRGGALWGRLPLRGLWWWAALIAARIGMLAIAAALGARAAGSVDAVFLVLGINRLAQSAMIGLRASRAGLPLGGPAGRSLMTGGL